VVPDESPSSHLHLYSVNHITRVPIEFRELKALKVFSLGMNPIGQEGFEDLARNVLPHLERFCL